MDTGSGMARWSVRTRGLRAVHLVLGTLVARTILCFAADREEGSGMGAEESARINYRSKRHGARG